MRLIAIIGMSVTLAACGEMTGHDGWKSDPDKHNQVFLACLEKAKVIGTVSDDDNAEVVEACYDASYRISLYKGERSPWARDRDAQPKAGDAHAAPLGSSPGLEEASPE